MFECKWYIWCGIFKIDKVKEAGGGEEALDGAKVLEHLNMQLMSVDSAVEVKYMDILQEDDEEKRKELEDGVSSLCFNQNILSFHNK